MQGNLVLYLKKRYEETKQKPKEEGPVITISREYGCPAKIIAEKLAEALSQHKDKYGEKPAWKWYNKEILEESAKELHLDPSKIKYVFEYETKGFLEDIFNSFSQRYYKSDRKIRAVISKVIRDIATSGHSIIIGRGGIAITRDMPNSLHINIEAPLEWRAVRLSNKSDISMEEAKKKCIETDKKRKEFRDSFQGKDNDYTRYDASFNCMTLTIDEIVQTILKMAEVRGFIV